VTTACRDRRRRVAKLNKQSDDSVPITPIAGSVLVLIVLILTLQFARNRRALNRFVGAVHYVDGVVATHAHRIRGNVVDASAGGFGYDGGMRLLSAKQI
jgi:hypothetical protein